MQKIEELSLQTVENLRKFGTQSLTSSLQNSPTLIGRFVSPYVRSKVHELKHVRHLSLRARDFRNATHRRPIVFFARLRTIFRFVVSKSLLDSCLISLMTLSLTCQTRLPSFAIELLRNCFFVRHMEFAVRTALLHHVSGPIAVRFCIFFSIFYRLNYAFVHLDALAIRTYQWVPFAYPI